MPAAHCPICITHYSIDKFSIFPCGHGFCTSCKDNILQQRRPTCPNCRVSIYPGDAHPVYLEVVDSKVAYASSVIEGLDQMGATTPLASVKKASQKLSKVLSGKGPEESALSTLIRAIDDFNERIIPLFTRVESQAHQLDQLRQDLRKSRSDRDNMQAKLKKSEASQAEVVRLEEALSETERNTQEAIRLAEVAKDDLLRVNESSTHWNKRAVELFEENKRFKDQLERHIESARSQKDKNRKQQKQIAELKQQLESKEKGAMSDATQDYDGDFSGHEHSKVHSSFHILSTPASSSSRTPRHSFYDENLIELDIEGMPSARFPSDWQLNRSEAGVLKKRSLNGPGMNTQRRVANPFPIDLDRKGHPTRAVQLGPKSLVHLGR
ncbi:hypothetical protein B0H34DRAFT_796602 [Crassisporium funariophilum]|nr:hypothetical protein B0H34DRAFT_796602 [Crassisporium funariophilum]